MRLPYPVSLPKLLLLGFTLVALPPVLALFGAYFSLDQLSRRSELAISRATAITRDSRGLSEHLSALERLARQQLILNDARGLTAYGKRRSEFIDTSERLSHHADILNIQPDLERLRRGENDVWQHLMQPDLSQTQSSSLISAFSVMNETAASIVSQSDARIEADINALQIEAAASRRQLL